MVSSFHLARRRPNPGKLLELPFSLSTSNTAPVPFTNHRFLSKNGNCLKLKLHCVSVDFGGSETKMEERWGWAVLMKMIWVITSWKMWPCTGSLLRSQRGQEGWGEDAQTSHISQGGWRMPFDFWGFPSAKNSQGPSQLYPPLSHKNPWESSAAAWKSTWTCDPEIPGTSCKQEWTGSGREEGQLWGVRTQLPCFLTTSSNLGSPPVQTRSRYSCTDLCTMQEKPVKNQCPAVAHMALPSVYNLWRTNAQAWQAWRCNPLLVYEELLPQHGGHSTLIGV